MESKHLSITNSFVNSWQWIPSRCQVNTYFSKHLFTLNFRSPGVFLQVQGVSNLVSITTSDIDFKTANLETAMVSIDQRLPKLHLQALSHHKHQVFLTIPPIADPADDLQWGAGHHHSDQDGHGPHTRNNQALGAASTQSALPQRSFWGGALVLLTLRLGQRISLSLKIEWPCPTFCNICTATREDIHERNNQMDYNIKWLRNKCQIMLIWRAMLAC